MITRTTIGRYCSIANNCSIGLGEHAVENISTSHHFYKNAYDGLTALSLTIGNDVWIGQDCIIRRGVTIGNGAVVGANSFVNKDVPAFAVVAGSPARRIKYRFTEDIIVKSQKSCWWDKGLAEAKAEIERLQHDIAQEGPL